MAPNYFNPGNSTSAPKNQTFESISGFISKAPATALMGMIFFIPNVQMWMLPKPKNLLPQNTYAINSCVIALIFFQIFFGAFLAIPNIYNSQLHGAVVGGFSFFGIIYFIFQVVFIWKYSESIKRDCNE